MKTSNSLLSLIISIYNIDFSILIQFAKLSHLKMSMQLVTNHLPLYVSVSSWHIFIWVIIKLSSLYMKFCLFFGHWLDMNVIRKTQMIVHYVASLSQSPWLGVLVYVVKVSVICKQEKTTCKCVLLWDFWICTIQAVPQLNRQRLLKDDY